MSDYARLLLELMSEDVTLFGYKHKVVRWIAASLIAGEY